MFRKRDFLWLLAYPIYQTIGTIRHEGSHALAVIWEGGELLEFVYWPSFNKESGILWGYVNFTGPTTWISLAAPYIVDVLTFALFFFICYRLRWLPHWLWLNLLILGLLSPLFDSLYAYQGGFYRPYNDVSKLLSDLPPLFIHGFFIITLLLYIVGLVVVVTKYRRGGTAKPEVISM